MSWKKNNGRDRTATGGIVWHPVEVPESKTDGRLSPGLICVGDISFNAGVPVNSQLPYIVADTSCNQRGIIFNNEKFAVNNSTGGDGICYSYIDLSHQVLPSGGGLNLDCSSIIDVSTIGFCENIVLMQPAGKSIAIGSKAGGVTGVGNQGTQDSKSIAIGENAGVTQGESCISIGDSACNVDVQNDYGIAIGCLAASQGQTESAISIGYKSGGVTGTPAGGIAIGLEAVCTASQGISIGMNAKVINRNSIALNAAATPLETVEDAAFYVDPIRNAVNDNTLYYNTSKREITYHLNDVNSSIIFTPADMVPSSLSLATSAFLVVESSQPDPAAGSSKAYVATSTSGIICCQRIIPSGYKISNANTIRINSMASLSGSSQCYVSAQSLIIGAADPLLNLLSKTGIVVNTDEPLTGGGTATEGMILTVFFNNATAGLTVTNGPTAIVVTMSPM